MAGTPRDTDQGTTTLSAADPSGGATQQHQVHDLAIIGRLAGGIAHDFNNLITVILGYAELLLSKVPAADPLREGLEGIHQAAEQAAALTQQLLRFGRKQAPIPQVLDLNAVVRSMDRMLRRFIVQPIDLRTSLGADLGCVLADPGQIEQVVLNLVLNARDAMPTGGKLTIETANAELDETACRVHGSARGRPSVLLAVSDTGCGMDAATRAHLFEPFFTTKDKGTGLGLASVLGIIRAYDGHIAVDSERGQGTTFRIFLPRVPAIVSASAQNPVSHARK